jgi:hypothetical protein
MVFGKNSAKKHAKQHPSENECQYDQTNCGVTHAVPLKGGIDRAQGLDIVTAGGVIVTPGDAKFKMSG